jgi:hypothetical protein
MKEINSQVVDVNNVSRGLYIREEMIDFLSHANFGFFPGTEIPLNFSFFPLLDLKIFPVVFLTRLFQTYAEVNNLQFSENGKKYYKAGPDMEKYLGNYLDALEEKDREKGEVYDAKGNLKPSFNRNRFVFNQHPSIYSYGFVLQGDYYKIPLKDKSLRGILISKIEQFYKNDKK